jgi:hypothetical protein
MATTSKQDSDFLSAVIGTGILESSVEWIKENMSPEEVFGEKELLDWAANYDPDSVFKVSELESWADNNGYIKE